MHNVKCMIFLQDHPSSDKLNTSSVYKTNKIPEKHLMLHVNKFNYFVPFLKIAKKHRINSCVCVILFVFFVYAFWCNSFTSTQINTKFAQNQQKLLVLVAICSVFFHYHLCHAESIFMLVLAKKCRKLIVAPDNFLITTINTEPENFRKKINSWNLIQL